MVCRLVVQSHKFDLELGSLLLGLGLVSLFFHYIWSIHPYAICYCILRWWWCGRSSCELCSAFSGRSIFGCQVERMLTLRLWCVVCSGRSYILLGLYNWQWRYLLYNRRCSNFRVRNFFNKSIFFIIFFSMYRFFKLFILLLFKAF